MTPPLLSQPKGLYLLFFTELWERFGFYTLQTILILYMSKALLYSDSRAYLIYAVFSGLLYLMPVLGGFLADRYLGYQRAIMLGGGVFVISYLITSLPGEQAFFFGLSVLICAHGLFKPNVSSLVGTLYDTQDVRREGGFTLFYMGINIGSLIPPLIAGYVVHRFGWHMGFLLAAAGMMLGLTVFVMGRRILGDRGATPLKSPLNKNALSRFFFYSIFFISLLILVLLVNCSFLHPDISSTILEGCGALVGLVVIVVALKQPPLMRNRMMGVFVLIIISIGFWALYNQTFTSLMLFAERNMQKTFLGFPINTEFTQFFNPFFIVILSPLLSQLWTRLSRRQSNLSYPSKFSWSILFICLGFLLLAGSIRWFSHDGMLASGWLAASYFMQTIGELLISPIALAMITELCPESLVGMMMGVWFFSNSMAAIFSGHLAQFTNVPVGVSTQDALLIYQHGFLMFGLFALILAAVSFLLIPVLKRLMADRH